MAAECGWVGRLLKEGAEQLRTGSMVLWDKCNGRASLQGWSTALAASAACSCLEWLQAR